MNTTQHKGLISTRNPQQWKLHQQLAQFIKDLDRLPEAQEARLNRPKSAPQHLLPMIF